jgi:hypothetical protein
MKTLTLILDRREFADFYSILDKSDDYSYDSDEISLIVNGWQIAMEDMYRKHHCVYVFRLVFRDTDLDILKILIDFSYMNDRWCVHSEKKMLGYLRDFFVGVNKENVYKIYNRPI